jgi:Domain of unknown function (DUF4389)
MAVTDMYPVRVDASLDAPLSRWLWLVKWVLLIPHYVVLAFLWLAFVVLSVVAMAVIVVTGRYPRAIFEFNVGVLRWTWRVQYYAIGAFGTDRYPPFTLADDPSYPAHLEIEYPQRLSRGLALVKWWLLAIPDYVIIGLFTGSGLWFAYRLGYHDGGWAGSGLIGILAVIAAVVLLIGTVRIQVAQASGTAPAFIGVAPAGAAARYLAGVDYATVRGAAGDHGTYTEHAGSAPAVPPGRAGIWTAHAAGSSPQTLTWAVRSGDWMVVAMNADGSGPVAMRVNVGATLPALPWIAVGLLVGGSLFLAGGVLLIVVPLRRVTTG